MGDEPDLDPDINKDFFEDNIMQLDPSLITESGMKWVMSCNYFMTVALNMLTLILY